MPMRSEIAVRPRPGADAAEPMELTWQSIVELANDPDFTIVASFIAVSLAASVWLAIKLPLTDVMAGLIGQVGYYP
jgi:hypothetical protein